MQVQEAARREIEQQPRYELAVVGQNGQVGRHGRQGVNGRGLSDSDRLQQRQPEPPGAGSDGRRRHDRLSADRSIGRRNDGLDPNARQRYQRIENRDGERAAAEEDGADDDRGFRRLVAHPTAVRAAAGRPSSSSPSCSVEIRSSSEPR